VVLNSQLASENFAKAIISLFEVPTWSHDPSDQLSATLDNMPKDLAGEVKELVSVVHELAPEHGRFSYGEPGLSLVPGEIYQKSHAEEAMEKTRRGREIAQRVLKRFGVMKS
jgi:HEPN domain-containing protein